MLTYQAIVDAQERLRPYVAPTPLEALPDLGAAVYLKLDTAQPTSSFKVRGALHALLMLDAESRARGIVAASSGNHAQGIAYAAGVLGIDARVYMPQNAPLRKTEGVRHWGGDARLVAGVYDDSERAALADAGSSGRVFISAYAHPDVIAGNGTAGLEIHQALPSVRRVIVPVGGGGLISGMAIALKEIDPTIEVIGVNATAAPDMYNHFYQTHLPLPYDTLADALPGAIEPSSPTLEIVPRYVDRIVLVDEAAIAEAIRWLMLTHGLITEGAGAAGVAALRSGAVVASDAPTAIMVCGGNIDADTLTRVLAGA